MSRKPYPTDISDTEWDLIKSMVPAERKRKRGKKREVDMREVVNAIFYILRAGCSWRMMPHDLPAWQTVYSYFQRWQRCMCMAKNPFSIAIAAQRNLWTRRRTVRRNYRLSNCEND
jgi:transposase